MQTQLTFPVTAEDVQALPNAPFRAGDFLTYVRTRRAEAHQYVVARVAGVIGVHCGVPLGAQVVGRVTGVWSQV
jgi:hypothetical protein